MNIFPLRRRDAALSELRLPDTEFLAIEGEEAVHEALENNTASPVNELATSVVELDIAEAVRADILQSTEPAVIPAPLSQRHLETIDRMVTHLKSDEKRLQDQIADAQRQLADTQLTRHGYERNGAELRRGITVLIRQATPKQPAAQRKPRNRRVVVPDQIPTADAVNGFDETDESAVAKTRGGKMH